MKVFISVDMEGISGIVDRTMVSRAEADYEKGRKLMVEDVNAAIDGVLSVGQAEIVVTDGHGGMNNIDPDDLNPEATLIRGSPKPLSQMAGVDEGFDACLFVGYHSKKGTLNGVMSHTYSGKNVECLHINGVEVGETAMNAGIAGYYGVPLVFVSGDLAVAEEAKVLVPGVEVAVVKEALGRVSARCLYPAKAREIIKAGAARAIRKRNDLDPLVFEPPIEFRIRFTDARLADAASFMPSAQRIDGKTISITHEDYIEAYHGFLAANMCAASVQT